MTVLSGGGIMGSYAGGLVSSLRDQAIHAACACVFRSSCLAQPMSAEITRSASAKRRGSFASCKRLALNGKAEIIESFMRQAS